MGRVSPGNATESTEVCVPPLVLVELKVPRMVLVVVALYELPSKLHEAALPDPTLLQDVASIRAAIKNARVNCFTKL